MKLVKKILVSLLTSGIAISSFAFDFGNKEAQTYKKYQLCDVNELAKNLAKGAFAVSLIRDHAANYNYYVVVTSDDFNADSIRKAVCLYVKTNKCYLYWGNIVNVAMLSDRPAPRFPLDTSPHYLMSPIVLCNKVK